MSKIYEKNTQSKRYELKQGFTLNTTIIASLGLIVVAELIAYVLRFASDEKSGQIPQRLLGKSTIQAIATGFDYLRYGVWILTGILIVIAAARIVQHVQKAGSFKKWLDERRLEKAVTKALVDTLSVNTMKEQSRIEVPDVKVECKDDEIIVKIERLAGMYELDTLKADVSSSFKNQYSNYVVTTARLSNNENEFIFTLEDLGSDKTFVPKSLDDLEVGNYNLKLQEGLIINLEDRPHLAIFGKSGSKKTTTLQLLLLELAVSQAKLYACDGKNELRSIDFIFTRYASAPDKILELTSDFIKELTIREKYKDGKVQKLGKMGLKASECGLKPMILVTDEVSAILAAMDKKEQAKFMADVTQIVMKGRSLGIYWVMANQDPSTNVFPQAIRAQFATKILLGNANQDIQKMALGEVATVGDVEDFRGYYVSDGLTKQPQKFYVSNIFEYGLNDLETFKNAKERGDKAWEKSFLR